jgi:TetR/AcrR family transcriptional repressor of uid operon
MTFVNDIDVMSNPATEPQSRRGRQRADTRERIFQAAVEEFLREGYAQAQIERIAESAGVVRGTFYFHFPSKEHVLRELMERRQAEIVRAMQSLRGSGASLRGVLAQLIESITLVHADLEASNLMREIMAMFVRARAEETEPTERELGILEELTHHVSEAAARGELRHDVEPDRMAAIVLTSVFGLNLARRTLDGPGHAEFDLLLDLLLEGMGAKLA